MLLPSEGIEFPDPVSAIIYLHCPNARIVLLQAHFELYEGLGIVRTVDASKSLLSILTTKDMLSDCLNALQSLQSRIGWSFATPKKTDQL